MYTLRALPEFEVWLTSLVDLRVRDAVMQRLTRVEVGLFGNARSLGDGVSELKIDLGAGWRVYYTQRGRQIIFLLTGGSKRTQERDIARAKALAATVNLKEFDHGYPDNPTGKTHQGRRSTAL